MRIAAGVILIIAMIINIFGAIRYLGGGALGAGGSDLSKMLQQEMRKNSKGSLTAEQKEAMAKLDAATAQASSSASKYMAFGGFLLLTVVTSLVAAIQLFRGKGATFIMIAALLAGVAEIISILMTSFGVTNIAGLLGAALALIAARAINARNARSAAAVAV
jgi:hypothetical protein